jgi:hypothetical protein
LKNSKDAKLVFQLMPQFTAAPQSSDNSSGLKQRLSDNHTLLFIVNQQMSLMCIVN